MIIKFEIFENKKMGKFWIVPVDGIFDAVKKIKGLPENFLYQKFNVINKTLQVPVNIKYLVIFHDNHKTADKHTQKVTDFINWAWDNYDNKKYYFDNYILVDYINTSEEEIEGERFGI